MARASCPYPRLLLYALIIGLLGGCVATAFYLGLKLGFALLWGTDPSQVSIGTWAHLYPYIPLVTAFGGLLVGLSVKFCGAKGGLAEAIAELHHGGRLSYRFLPGMALASGLSLLFGSSAGPESPMIDINGGLGTWLAARLNLSPDSTRILTLCGMAAGMSVFFESPLGATLFVLELPHRRSLEFYEAILPALISAVAGFTLFRVITGTTIGGIYRFPTYDSLRPEDIGFAVLIGIIGAAVGTLFVFLDRQIERWLTPYRQYPLVLIVAVGFLIGLIALIHPITLFYGERQIEQVIQVVNRYSISILLSVAFFKLLALSLCLQGGFRGGVVFPLFFVGACVGMAVHQALPNTPLSVALAGMMAAITVVVTKTPLGLAVILTVISHTAVLPLITIATLSSYLLTLPIAWIPSQRSRQDPPDP
ncbi:MAG: chloride channel [Thermosynechococcus sp.]|uniref:chloride channel protein n=1 Tax=Thermosynechococcus sp. TaxID=2814275 RepID=UPI0021FFF59D|nr:chloride channel protein [Thermosynechococcus sp.]BCX12145.1 MAG: chloride channel [Thermosynechococcus sp.]